MRPKLLDLFCGAGGAAVGYHRAGFDVVGIDIKPQPHYPFSFIQADALHYIHTMTARSIYTAIHASPPCQGYSRMNHVHKREYPMLIEPIRKLLIQINKPYVIENVEGAPLINPISLCGSSFGLQVLRHRIFECSISITPRPCASHKGTWYSPSGHGDPNWRHRDLNPHLKGKGYTQRCREAMGIDWMNRDELAESIPPAYTEYIGKQLITSITKGSK